MNILNKCFYLNLEISNSLKYSTVNENIRKKDEFNIIKNNLIYNIKLILYKKDKFVIIKVVISFVKNNTFQIYEAFLENNPEIGKIDNYIETYQAFINQIKKENIEIILKIIKKIYFIKDNNQSRRKIYKINTFY